jgi:hypothetical protein
VTPHLTVAHRVGVEVLDAIAQELSGRLPIQCQATEAWLMCSDDMGMWSRHEVFEFDGRRP